MKKVLFFAICTLALLSTSCEPNEPGTSSIVKTGTPSDITIESVVLHGVVNIDISKYNSVKCGIMISESKTEINAREGEKFRAEELIGKDFKLQINGLSAKTKYYYCAYVYLNNIQYEYGEVKEFETNAPNLAEVITKEVTKVGLYSATVTGSIIDDCGASIIETGIVYCTSKEPKISDEKVTLDNKLGDFTHKITGLQDNTTYYICIYAINEVGVSYGNVINFTTMKREYKNGHECIDLGLSVKWATCNVGANKPEEYGDHFAWGETKQKSNYSWETYKWSYYGDYSTMTKYGDVDNKTTLDLSDDAARANWGDGWRMPTIEQFQELLDNTTEEWVTDYNNTGKKGMLFTSKHNNNTIFLPAAGCYGYGDGTGYRGANSYGEYWSSSRSTDWFSNDYYAYCVSVMYYYGEATDILQNDRHWGRSVRPVYP